MRISKKAQQFGESVIRDMTRRAIQHNAVNLAQGFPDFGAPEDLKLAARQAIDGDINQYAITWGAVDLRTAIARKFEQLQGVPVDPATEITVCCGSTEAMIATLLGVLDPGEEIIVFEPFYENYGPDAILSEASIRYVDLYPPDPENSDWRFNPDELHAAFNQNTRAIIINTPHNPTGKVFTRDELKFIAGLCNEFDAIAVTDEIYEHILYDGHQHISIASLPEMRDRTVTISSLSKTYSVTGWRVGWAIAAPALTAGIRKVHDFLTVGAAAPLQAAGAAALSLPQCYYEDLAEKYTERRDLLLNGLREIGLKAFRPRGAYYIIADFSPVYAGDDTSFAMHLLESVSVAAVPGSSFYRLGSGGSRHIRFTFCKKIETLERAIENLRKL